MQFLITLFVLASCLMGAIASPVVNGTMIQGQRGGEEESLQLLFVKYQPDGVYWHFLFHGLKEVQVDPCKAEDGGWLWKAKYGTVKDNGDILFPPWPKQKIKVNVPMDYWVHAKDCLYVNDGKDNPGTLECGTDVIWLRFDLGLDPAVHNKPVLCGSRNYNVQREWKRMAFVDY